MQATHAQHVRGQSIETSEGHNTRGMQYNAQMVKQLWTDLKHAKTVAKTC